MQPPPSPLIPFLTLLISLSLAPTISRATDLKETTVFIPANLDIITSDVIHFFNPADPDKDAIRNGRDGEITESGFVLVHRPGNEQVHFTGDRKTADQPGQSQAVSENGGTGGGGELARSLGERVFGGIRGLAEWGSGTEATEEMGDIMEK